MEPIYKVSAPSDLVVDIYYYYSYAILGLCWIIAPFLFYIILTQSTKLGHIKWLILNHCFWCLALETSLCLVKPLFLLPCPGGIHIGLFKNYGGFQGTAIAALICFSCMINCVFGLMATISSRYMFVFPSKWKIFENVKANFIFIFVTATVTYSLTLLIFIPILSVDISDIHQWGLEFDPFLVNFFHEQSFFLIPHKIIDQVLVPLLTLQICTFFLSTGFSIHFIKQIFKHQTSTTTRLQKSLIFSSIMQIHLTNIFLLLPILMFFIFITFHISHSATAMVIFMSIFMTHCFVEFLATLYFIAPYRNYIILKFFKKQSDYRKTSKTSSISITVW